MNEVETMVKIHPTSSVNLTSACVLARRSLGRFVPARNNHPSMLARYLMPRPAAIARSSSRSCTEPVV